ncbi:YihY/virulence factor BrkB family protein [Candidatus Stoquefichus sp. SB1]|jgi:membrane protein|uniref:YihY/virulence factor BrkB family protein n=1 Tax=Candidatus Stoquefichus sp. SB1 TaxID=1658109 RepID=UPI00067EC68B|nr:YihY/virulence factor BrkB family protein [Candidatus Stoquefichus sp. SB1]
MIAFYERCVKIYDDYRAVVPPYAAAALSFYLLLILIPAFSLIAVGTSLLNIDMGLIESLIQRIVMPTYSQMLIDILESRSMNTVALITMIISIYTVSRGIGNIYEISKNMYHQHIEETIVGYYIYTFKVTIFLLLLFIGIIAILALGPLAYIFNFLYSYFGIRHIVLYFLMVFCLMSIYLIVPRIRIHYGDAFQGALVASALMLVLYYGLNIYFRFADFQSVYGPLASIVVILFVFDWAAEIFYIGMYITNILHLRREK